MRTFRHRVTGLILLAFLSITDLAARGAEPDNPPLRVVPGFGQMSANRLLRINDLIGRYIAEQRISGAVTLVARQGVVVHFEAHGVMDVATKAPMRRDSLFRMASSSKPVTGVAIMLLIEEGKVALSDPVAKFIPEFKTMQVAVADGDGIKLIPAARPITIRDLMTHTSGLASGGIGMRNIPREKLGPGGSGATLAEGAAFYATVPLDFQPGTLWRYSGLAGIDALARVVEVASGQNYDEFLKARVFGPLGMTETSFTVPEELHGRLVSVHQRVDGKLTSVPSFIRFPDTYSSGAGGLVSTAEDYFRFAQSFIFHPTSTSKTLLSPRGVELMGSNFVGDLFEGQAGRPKGMGFGLTVEVVVDPAQAGTYRSKGSFGWDGAFGTHFWVDPTEKLVAVLMIQTGGTRDLHRDFETVVMQAIED